MRKRLWGLVAAGLIAGMAGSGPAIAAPTGTTMVAKAQPSASPTPKKKKHTLRHAAEIGAGAAILHHEHEKHKAKKAAKKQAKKAAKNPQPSPSAR